MLFRRFLILALPVFLLAACGSEVVTPSATFESTAVVEAPTEQAAAPTAAPPIATAKPPTPTTEPPTPTAEPPTATARPPTATARPPTPTRAPPTETPSPTPEPDVAAIFEAIAPPRALGDLPSPDGRYRAEVLAYDCALLPPPEGEGDPYEQAYEMLRLVDAGGQAQVVADQRIACGGLGGFGLQAYFWSADGRYLYYGDAREGSPDGCGYFDAPYYRLDTAGMTTAYLGFGPASPDGTMLALWSPDEALVVYAVGDEEPARIPIAGPNRIRKQIAWSPDGRSLVYLLTGDYCPDGASTLTRLDLSDLKPVVLREDDPGYSWVSWESADVLQLSSIVGEQSLRVNAADGSEAP